MVFRNGRVFGNAQQQFYVRTSNDRFVVEDSLVTANQSGPAVGAIQLEGDGAVVRGTDLRKVYYGIYTTGRGDTIENNTISDAQVYGIYHSSNSDTGTLITGNRVFNADTGIYASSGNSQPTLVAGNETFNNRDDGIYGVNDVLVQNNTSWDNVNAAIRGTNGAVIENNLAYYSGYGVVAGAFSQSATARNNRVFANTQYGLLAYSSSLVEGNVSYGNAVGIGTTQSSSNRVKLTNNLVYDNADAGIRISNASLNASSIVNNTIVQPAGNGIEVVNLSRDVEVFNNIIQVQQGAAIVVASDSQDRFISDHNVIYAPGPAILGVWGAKSFDDRADWYHQLGLDQHSQFGESGAMDPLFEDPDGPNDIRGYDLTTVGPAVIVDDGDPGFSTSVPWTQTTTSGHGGDLSSFLPSPDPSEAAWTFSGLIDGATYQIAATWTNGNFASVRYDIHDDSDRIATRSVNQYFTSPNDFNDAGSDWENLAVVEISGTTLEVRLTAATTVRPTQADAIRIQRIVGDRGADDNFHLLPGSPAIDAADPGASYVNEPAAAGGRRNAGAYGDTVEAATSPSASLQILSPADYDKLYVGQAVDISWHADGDAVVAPADDSSALALAASGPLVHYRLNELSGMTVADSSSNALQGTVVNSADFGVQGAFGPGLDTSIGFQDDNDYINVPHDPLLDPSQLTVEAWVYAASNISTYDSVLNKSSNTAWGNGYGIYYYNGSIHFYVNGYTATPNLLAPLPKEEWVHVLGTFDGSTARFYVNGQFIAEQTGLAPYVASGADLEIGRGKASTYSWKGSIDEVAIYDRVLSETEIGQHATVQPTSSVDIDLIDEISGVVTPIAADVIARGSTSWTIPASLTTDREYRLRITSNDPSGVIATSFAPLQIVPQVTNYYVNDNSLVGDAYTTAVGDNSNSGTSPGKPMADLRALLQAYDLGPGDTVFVDTGDYELLRNLYLRKDDSGVTIQGPTSPAVATLDRNNTTTDANVIDFVGADDVTISSLQLTGGYYGVYAATNQDSDDNTFSNVTIFNNSNHEVWIRNSNDAFVIADSEIFDALLSNLEGVYLESDNNQIIGTSIHGHRYGIYQPTGSGNSFIGNEIFDNTNWGLYSSANVFNGSIQIVGNEVYGNYQGIYTTVSQPLRSPVSGNFVHDNQFDGIYATGYVDVVNNVVAANQRTGIVVVNEARAVGNVAHGNVTGIQTGGFSQSATAISNRVFDNSAVGIAAYNVSLIDGNFVYSNSVGILGANGSQNFRGDVANNLIYANTDQGVLIDHGNTNAEIFNNTIYQPVGDAIRLTGSSQNVRLGNNVLRIDSGYGIFVEPGNTGGLVSSSNLFQQGTDPNAFVGHWSGTDADSLVDWQTQSGLDVGSLEADPLFIDIDGADNVLGFDPLANAGNGYDGGSDDNFIVRKTSPTIDRGDSWLALDHDLQSSSRLDDPDTVNQGTDDYYEVDLGLSNFSASGVAQNWRSTNTYWTYNLPFSFPLFGQSYSSVYVAVNGLLQFGTTSSITDDSNSTEKLDDAPRVAPLWDKLSTNGVGDDIFIDTTIAGQVTIRWDATNDADGSDVHFATTLFENGEVQFHYGGGNTNLTPTIGISAPGGRHVAVSANDGATSLTDANSVQFDLQPGFVDIGAYEFRGESSDVIAPVVTGTIPQAVDSQLTTTVGIDSLRIVFSEEVNNIDANALAAYDLRASGLNGLFGDGDDAVFTAIPSFLIGNDFVDLSIAQGILPPGNYRLTIPSGLSRSIHDTAGLRLDGNNDAIEGGDYQRFFNVAVNQQPVANAQTVAGTEDTEAAITLSGDDGDVAVAQTLTYWITQLPSSGQLSTTSGGPALTATDLPFAAPSPTLYFTPAANSVLSETFGFYVQDDGSTANGGSDTSAEVTVTINLAPVADPPVLPDATADLPENSVNATVVATLGVSDPDLGDPVPDTHTYQILSGNADNAFSVNNLGEILLNDASQIDFESAAVRNLVVEVTDSGGLKDSANVDISIVDILEPRVESIQINGGSVQRSAIREVTLTFNQIVSIDQIGGDPFVFLNLGTLAEAVDAPVISESGGKTVVTFTFLPGASVDATGSLVDGDYQLTIDYSRVTANGMTLDGNGDGATGDSHVFGADPLDKFFRKYGDGTGNNLVELFDFAQFRSTFGLSSGAPNYLDYMDWDGNGIINLFDFAAFRSHFGT